MNVKIGLICLSFRALPAPVLWAQRSNLVYIRIAVEDVQSPEVKVEKDKIHYKFVFHLIIY